jgi:uncharacterized protein Veg
MPTKQKLLSSIKDPYERAQVVSAHVGERVNLTIRLGNDRTITGDLVAMAGVYGSLSYVAVIAYIDAAGTHRVQAVPHTFWRQIEPAGDES